MTQRFKRLSHSLYERKYHLVFCPKYRYRILCEILTVLLSEADISDFPGFRLAFSPVFLLKMVSVKITFPYCSARLQLPEIV